MTLWIVYTFEMQKVGASPVQLGFYGFFAWTFIIRSSLPLSIFYRYDAGSIPFSERVPKSKFGLMPRIFVQIEASLSV